MSLSLRGLLRFQESGLLVVILVLGAFLTAFSGTVRAPLFQEGPDGTRERVFITDANGERTPAFVERNKFLNAQNLAQLAKVYELLPIAVLIGSIYALASVAGALVLNHFGPGGPAGDIGLMGSLAGAAVCLGTALVCGLTNGGLIVALRVHPFIVTLGTMAVFRGVAFVATQGQSVGGFPQSFRDLIRIEVGQGLSVMPLLVMIAVTVVGWVALSRLAAGRRVYAIGGNELASRFSGIRIERVKLGVYLMSALAAGIAALLSLGYYGGATSGDGQGYELSVIAAAVVGGASLSGGRGSALGVVLGALIIQMINSGIVILGIDQNYSQIIIGSVVIAAVVLDNVNSWLAQRRLQKASES